MGKIITIEDFAKLSAEDQRKQLQYWNDEYYNYDSSDVSDEIYDTCVNLYNQNNEPLNYLGAAGDFEKYEHPYPVLSLDKINTREAYDKAIEKFSGNVLIQPKVDGLTVVYYPDGKLVSRGDGHTGEVLPWAHLIPGLPAPMDKPVRMEVYISKENFKKYFAGAGKNARNMAAGILRRKEYSTDIKRLSYVAYNIMGSDEPEMMQRFKISLSGFYAIDFLPITSVEIGKDAFSHLESWSKEFPYETDGIVIKSNEGALEARYGHTGHHPNGMVAYKFKSAVATTTLRSIEWSYGRDKITPVAVFDPVELGGTTVSRASLHNLNVMRSLNIRLGAKVQVTKKNEIIPQIIHCDATSPEDFASWWIKCPMCHSFLKEQDNGELYCENENCNGRILEDCLRMSSKDGLDIQGLSEQTWKAILSAKLEHYNPFLLIKEARDYLKAPDEEWHYGLTNKIWTKLCHAIVNAATDIPLDKFLVACNIPLVGKSTAKDIAEFCEYDSNNLFLKRLELNKVLGIGPETIQSLDRYWLRMTDNMARVSIKEPEKKKKDAYTVVKKVAITGTLSHPRSYYEKQIQDKGWHVSSSVSGATHYLLCGEKAGSKKEKAEKLGIKVLTEEEFEKLMKES
jgi:DNA ligase (NAD+)